MRVLHVINSIGKRAGAELSLIAILARTASEQLEHNVTVLDAADPEVPELTAAGVHVHRPPRPLGGRVGHVRFVRQQIRSMQPDLIHSTLFDADLAARIAGRLERTPVISSLVNMPYTDHGMRAESAKAWKLRAVRTLDGLLARHATAGFHAITEAVAQHAVESLRIDPGTVRVIPRGRSREQLGEHTEERRAQVRRRMGWEERTVLLNVARQEPQKGQVHLIEALADLRSRVPEVLLVIVGREGRSSPDLHAAASKYQLREHIDFLDVRSDVPDLLVGADLFVFPSLYEGLGGAVVEAMGAGCPVIAFDTPAVREVLDDGRAGRLVPLGDATALARQAGASLADPHGSQTMAQRARRRFDEVYELERCLDGMNRLYREIEGQIHSDTTAARRHLDLRI